MVTFNRNHSYMTKQNTKAAPDPATPDPATSDQAAPATPDQAISGEMLIGELLNLLPEGSNILTEHGLHCVGCDVNDYESIRDGAAAHGIPEDEIDAMVAELNDLAKERKRKNKASKGSFYVTKTAAEKIRRFAKAEEKEEWGLKITVTESGDHENGGHEPVYSMDFQESPAKDDKTFTFHKIKIFVDPNSLKLLSGTDIDYLKTQYGDGFKFFRTS